MRKIFGLIFMLSMFLFFRSNIYAYDGGNGSSLEPFKIANTDNLTELMKDSANWDKNFILTGNIDCSSISDATPIGSITKNFTGCFDGNDYTISNLVINLPNQNNVGLFGCNKGEIKNVNLINSNFNGQYGVGSLIGLNFGKISNCIADGINITGYHDIGGFCGYNYGNIINCNSNIVITGYSSVGGFCGRSLHGYIYNCFSEGEVICNYNGAGFCFQNKNSWIEACFTRCNVNGQNGVIAGFCCELFAEGVQFPNTQEIWSYSVITNCYATGNLISNKGNKTGFCNIISSNYDYVVAYIKDCYFSGNFNNKDNSYGFCFNNNKHKLNNCFWDIEKSGIETSFGGEGKTTLEMFTQSTFKNWDFNNIWYMPPNDYPKLQPFKTVAVEENNNTLSSGLLVYPNPASDFIEITIDNKRHKPFIKSDNVQIYNTLGVKVITTTSVSEVTPQEGNFRIHISGLPSGVYYIRIGNRVNKFVKM